MFKKKFKVQVCHYAEDKYTVDYIEYYFLPIIWNTLHYWFDQGHPGGTECWSTKLFSVHEAEKIAIKLKSTSDIDRYYAPEILKSEIWKAKEIEFCKRNIPYNSKTFNS